LGYPGMVGRAAGFEPATSP